MTEQHIERIARGLSDDCRCDFLGYRFSTLSPANIHVLRRLGLVEWADGLRLKVTPTGLKVRAYLQEQGE